MGHPLEEGTKLGPVVCKSQYEKVGLPVSFVKNVVGS